MATATLKYKYCFDGTTLSQKADNEWAYLMPYVKQKYADTTSQIGKAVLAIDADIASFKVNFPHAFDLTSSEETRNSFGLSLAIMVNRLLTNVGVLEGLLPVETDIADTTEDANMRYSIVLLTQTLTILQTNLPVPCP